MAVFRKENKGGTTAINKDIREEKKRERENKDNLINRPTRVHIGNSVLGILSYR